MRVLVTGGSGFIGSAVVHQVLAAGHDVLNLDALTYAGCTQTLATAVHHPNYQFARVDLREYAALKSALDAFAPDAVLHLAAETHVDRSIHDPGVFVASNITGTYHLLEAARGYWTRVGCPLGFRFHHVSTDEVFGSLGTTGSFSETTPYAPRSPYSASKAASDHLVRAWGHTYGLPVLLSNCSNNYGPYQFPEKLIPVMILKAISGQGLPIYGNGAHRRDWLYVADHAAALMAILARGKVGQSYNIGGNAERSNLEVVQKLCAILDRKRPKANGLYADQIQFVADRPGHDARYAINASRIRDQLGWCAQTSFEHGLEATIDWYLSHEDWWRPRWHLNAVDQAA